MNMLKKSLGLMILLMCLNLAFAQDPIANYSFDVDASDATGTYNGTLVNDAAIVNDGVRGKVLGLTDSGYVSIPPAIADAMNSFSFAGWVKFNGTVNWAGLVGMGQDELKSFPYFDYHLRSSGGMSFYSTKYVSWPSDGCSKTIDGYTVPKGEWVHIAFSFTLNDTAIVYVNGQAVSTVNWKTIQEFDVAPDSLGAEVVTIGRDAFNQGTLTNTKIDEFKFYDEAITAEKVAEIYNAEVVAVEPIADYSFDVDASDATGTYNGSLEGDAAIVNDGVRGTVLGLKADGYVSVPPAIANEMHDFSFCGWVKFNGTNGYAALMGMGMSAAKVAPYWDFHLRANGTVSFYAAKDVAWPSDGCSKIVDGYTMPVNEWVHVALSFTQNDTAIVYINGEAKETKNWKDIQDFHVSPDSLGAEVVNIGKDAFNQTTLTNTKIDNFKFYKTDISAEFVAKIYNDELITVEDFLVAHWKFEGDAKDELGTSDGTLMYGDASLYVDGLSGKAIDFSGATDTTHIFVPHNDVIDFDSTQSFTVSVLIKGENLSSGGRVLVKGASSNQAPADHPTWDGKRYEMYFTGDGSLRFAVDDDVTKTQCQANGASSIMDPNGFNHIVGVRDVAQDSLFTFINGNKVASLFDGTDLDISNLSPLIIGNVETLNNGIFATIDDIRIYNYALNADKVKALYDSYDIPVGINGEQGVKPMTYELMQNYPNPFNPSTTIKFQTPKDGLVTVTVYNTLGQRVTTLVNENMKSGIHQVTFNAAQFSSGIYFYRMKSKDFSQVKKMMLLK